MYKYTIASGSRLRRSLRLRPIQRLKAQSTRMPAAQVLSLLDELDAAGVRVGEYAVVAEALARQGYRKGESEHSPGLPMPWRHAWCHDDGYSVEVLPVALRRPPFNWPARSAFAQGSIGGRPVPCLSAVLQLTLRDGYAPRAIDAVDTELLRAYLDRASRP